MRHYERRLAENPLLPALRQAQHRLQEGDQHRDAFLDNLERAAPLLDLGLRQLDRHRSLVPALAQHDTAAAAEQPAQGIAPPPQPAQPVHPEEPEQPILGSSRKYAPPFTVFAAIRWLRVSMSGLSPVVV